MAASHSSPFPPVRRVITGHTPDGKSTVLADAPQPPRFFVPSEKSPMYDIHHASESPAVIDSEITQGKWVDESLSHPELFGGNGSNWRCWDMAPGQVTVIHRTVTIDYGLVFRGSIVLELDDGQKVTLNEGDSVVQRGTMHTWRNESKEWTRMYFVMMNAKPIEIEGKTLGAEIHEAK
ncbi:cupin-2 domain-containing protein [Favolaschia claudopus]|uniref:Cupin-2 domain-containing protein n=1 Tax=Favolaschia claudopus TaxID=2862362 RepID=A0AAW0EK21_9AGAR